MSLRLSRGTHLPDHAFGWGQLVYAASGVARVTTDRGHWVLPVGRALWVPPDVRHVLHCVTSIDLRTLYFPPDGLPALDRSCTVVEVGSLLRELILRAVAVALDSSPVQRRLLAVLYDELAVAPGESLHLRLPSDPAAAKLATKILEQEAFTVSLDELTIGLGASRRTLERRFRDQTGLGLGAWYRQARFQRSLLLLGNGESVGAVAAACGYSSVSAFVAAFRRQANTTPARYFS